ncbi:MAG TPA: CAP domain-containing protein [Chloroflexota bacterium]|nr:CAP domain-containing protein [Chloroflexota bacterium]
MAGTTTARNLVRAVLLALSLLAFSPRPFLAHASPSGRASSADCPVSDLSTDPSVVAGRSYLGLAYNALTHDRQQYAGLGPLRRSATLSAIAELHSVYMASIGSWSDGDPAGTILARVQAAGIPAVYAGQNVVTSSGATVSEAIQHGEAFFSREADGGGPHWDNITNPNHHAVGIGISLLGDPGNYTIYLTQVFADSGGCTQANPVTLVDASQVTPALHPGLVVRPTVDDLQLRSEPRGLVIGHLTSRDKLKVIGLQGNWAQVQVLGSQTFGWIFTQFVSTG